MIIKFLHNKHISSYSLSLLVFLLSVIEKKTTTTIVQLLPTWIPLFHFNFAVLRKFPVLLFINILCCTIVIFLFYYFIDNIFLKLICYYWINKYLII